MTQSISSIVTLTCSDLIVNSKFSHMTLDTSENVVACLKIHSSTGGYSRCTLGLSNFFVRRVVSKKQSHNLKCPCLKAFRSSVLRSMGGEVTSH